MRQITGRWMMMAVLLGVFVSGCQNTAQSGEEDGKNAKNGKIKPSAEQRQVAVKAKKLLENSADTTTPARESINYLQSDRIQNWIKAIYDNKAMHAGTLNYRLRKIRDLASGAENGLDWPEPPVAEVPYIEAPPNIDGKLTDAAWEKALTYNKTYLFNHKSPTDKVKTTWKIAWDKDNLYFAFDCPDSNIIAKKDRKRDGKVYFDDCVEMYLLPVFRWRTYWELDISPAGIVYDAVKNKYPHKWGAVSDTTQTVEGLEYAFQIRGTLNNPDDKDQGYSAEVAVPFDQLPSYTRTSPSAGDKLHFMLLRLEKGEKGMKACSYQPLAAWGHNIWNHAEMRLVE